MFIGFKHKGLERFFTYEQGRHSGKAAERLRLILGPLHASSCPREMNLPGSNLRELTGELQGYWAVKVSGNWRVIFSLCRQRCRWGELRSLSLKFDMQMHNPLIPVKSWTSSASNLLAWRWRRRQKPLGWAAKRCPVLSTATTQ